MQKKALVVIDIQNDMTKNYKEVIGTINQSIDWAVEQNMHVVYIRHENLSVGTRTFKTGTRGAELAPDLKIVSDHIFTKYKGNALTSEAFAAFIEQNDITDFYLTGGDATACVKSTCFNLRKLDYGVTVITDGITSYDKKKLPEMIEYYAKKGSHIVQFNDLLSVD